jgi:hypothetical protein
MDFEGDEVVFDQEDVEAVVGLRFIGVRHAH